MSAATKKAQKSCEDGAADVVDEASRSVDFWGGFSRESDSYYTLTQAIEAFNKGGRRRE